MELRHLRYFVAVARHLSFTQAAKSIHVAQAALSETIKGLEQELGVELLARTRQAVRLTAAGESFLRNSERILRDVADAARTAGQIARGETGRVSIGFLGATVAPFLPRLLRDFRRSHPNVEIALIDTTPRELAAALSEGRIDVAITRPEEERSYAIPIDRSEIFASELCAAFPRNHPFAREKGPLPIKRMAREPIVLPARSGAPWFFDTVIATCRKAGFVPRLAMTPNHSSTALVLVEAGFGVGIVSASATHSVAGRGLRFRPLAPRAYAIPTLLVWPRGLQSPAANAFVAYVQAQRAAIAMAMGNSSVG